MLNKHFDTNRVQKINDYDALAYSFLEVYSEQILDFLHDCLKVANTKENCYLHIPCTQQSLDIIYHAERDSFEVIYHDILTTDTSVYSCIRDLRDYLEHFYVRQNNDVNTLYQFALSDDEKEA